MLMLSSPLLGELNIRMMQKDVSSNTAGAVAVGGNGSITGRVLENGVPVSRRVMLYDRSTGAYAGQTRSDSEGSYIFKRTNELAVYFVVSIDDNNNGVQFNLKGQDLISGNHDNINS